MIVIKPSSSSMYAKDLSSRKNIKTRQAKILSPFLIKVEFVKKAKKMKFNKVSSIFIAFETKKLKTITNIVYRTSFNNNTK